MAYENVQFTGSNFCMGPQNGTMCSLDTTSTTTVLKIKNLTGGAIMDLNLSSNIITANPRLEYVGPYNLSTVKDDLTFFTFEKVSDSVCMIKRWATRVAFRELLLKEQIVKSTSGDERYNAIDFAVEYYQRTFTYPNEYYNYLDMSSVENVRTGTKFFLGPSSDTSNLGATETVTVSHIIDYIGGQRVYLTAPIQYQYSIGDLITFYSHVYIFSSDGYAGDENKGTLFKIDAYSWITQEVDLKAIYKKISASKWCPAVGAVASIVGTNMLFVRPYDSYQIWRSMFLNNVKANKSTTFPVYDVVFNDYSVYKLQSETTLRDDAGVRTNYDWVLYNYQSDTLLPYTSSIVTWSNQNIVTGYNKNVDIEAQVRDQFHVGLRDVDLNFYVEGDTGALLDPLSGLVTTDIDGRATINYRSGSSYSGHTAINTRGAGSSTSTGSQYVWTANNIISMVNANPEYVGAKQIIPSPAFLFGFRQILDWYRHYNSVSHTYYDPYISLFAKSFFTSPGGDWGSGGGFYSPSVVQTWLPLLYRGSSQTDAPRLFEGGGFTNWPYPVYGAGFIGNQIKLVLDITSSLSAKAVNYYLLYTTAGIDSAHVPYIQIKAPEESSWRYIDQLKLSLHTYWVSGVAYDYLWGDVRVDQFVFVEDAVPQFWSEKNPINTNIWLRLRPFAFSLDLDTLKIWVREISYEGDTGFVDFGDYITLTTFNAGSGVLGIEVTCNPPVDFHYGSLVYVRIEVYDEALDPNFIYVEYWFEVTLDYKSPYLTNLSPSREQQNVSVDTQISFEVWDDGTGVDISSLECLLNSRRMHPDNIEIEEVSRYHYTVRYTPPEKLYYGKDYKVTVKVEDLTPERNALNDAYLFYTETSAGVSIIDPVPSQCKRGMSRFEPIEVKVLADGNGIDLGSVVMNVYEKTVEPKKMSIVYRVS